MQAVIFDVDGVLLDTVKYHFHAWQQVFQNNNVAFSFDEYLVKVNGQPRITGVTNVLPNISSDKVEKIAAAKQAILLKMFRTSPPLPLPGVSQLLRILKKYHIPLAAASSSKNAPLLLKKANIDNFFDVIISGKDFTLPKPHPQIFLHTSAKLHISPKECVVVEDAAVGVEAAKKAGMKTIGILTSHDNQISSLADITLSSLQEQQKILDFILFH